MEEEIQKAIDLLAQHGYDVVAPQAASEIIEDFEAWWELYAKKRGREKCLKRWMRMPKKDRAACIAATPAYVRSVTEKQYQKDPYTYLNGRCWEDEIIDPYDDRQQRATIDFTTKATAIFNAK